MFEPTWTAERIELLKSGVEAGLSCRQIANDIGVSRNAVIGKISRLNLSRAEGAGARSFERRREPRLDSRPARPTSVSQRQVLTALDIAPVVEEAPLTSEHRCSLLELSEENCRWPIGNISGADLWFCGNMPVKGLSYCAGHARIAYHSSRQRGWRPSG
jgi:GcrA cell cycle regulator